MNKESKEKKITDEEIQSIIDEAKNISLQEELIEAHELPLNEKAIESELHNPEKAYNLYYRTYQKLLKKYLRREAEFKKINSLIRYQANLYLKEGNTKGRDGRQAYRHRLVTVCNNIIAWANEGNRLDFIGLYQRMEQLNLEAK
jgi:hypothetical protein